MSLLFPALLEKPSRIRYVDQESDEIIELFLRQHWVTNVPWMLFALLFALIPILAANYVPALFPVITDFPGFVVPASLTLWYMVVSAVVIEKFLHWYFNIYIVTNHHVVDINFDSILHREKLEAGIENVESAQATIAGIVRSLFNYGDVTIQTAAETQNIVFSAVPKPDKVVDVVNDLRRARGGRHVS